MLTRLLQFQFMRVWPNKAARCPCPLRCGLLRCKHPIWVLSAPHLPPPHPLVPQPVAPSQRLRVLGEGQLLQIQPTRVSDSGRYLCVATNVAGEDDQDFNVLIQGERGPWGRVAGTCWPV